MLNRVGNFIGFNQPQYMTPRKQQIAQNYRTNTQNQANQLFSQVQNKVAQDTEMRLPKINSNGQRIGRNLQENNAIRVDRLRGPKLTPQEFSRRFNNLRGNPTPITQQEFSRRFNNLKGNPTPVKPKITGTPLAQLNQLNNKLKNLPKFK